MRLVQSASSASCVGDVGCRSSRLRQSRRSGDQERAEASFNTILARGKTHPDAMGFNHLINASAMSNDTVRAEFWLSKMLELWVTPNVASYTPALHTHGREGNIEAAEKGLERMREKGVEANVFSYSALIHACAQTGETDRAELWFN
jgi:pentatricopeptide repeat protein